MARNNLKNKSVCTIVFNIFRHVEVNNMLNVRKIKAFRCYISCYHDIFLPFSEASHCILSFFLIYKKSLKNVLQHSYRH